MKKIIIDTDIGSDPDDAGALAITHNLCSKGECEILCITHCTSRASGAKSISAINHYYNRPYIKIGTLMEKSFLDADKYDVYSKKIHQHFSHRFASDKLYDSVELLRKTLSEQEDESVTLIAIGPLINIAKLLKSKSDDICKLDGIELCKKKIKELCIMGGHFAETSHKVYFDDTLMEAEWNISQDILSAQYVFEKYPGEIMVIPFEVGEVVKTGRLLFEKFYISEHPVLMAYKLYADSIRESWDPITVYYSIRGEADFEISNYGEITINDKGVSIFNEIDLKHRYIIRNKNNDDLKEKLDNLII
jgi:inosine-uridine nucleoside N-ribohydrolase